MFRQMNNPFVLLLGRGQRNACLQGSVSVTWKRASNKRCGEPTRRPRSSPSLGNVLVYRPIMDAAGRGVVIGSACR